MHASLFVQPDTVVLVVLVVVLLVVVSSRGVVVVVLDVVLVVVCLVVIGALHSHMSLPSRRTKSIAKSSLLPSALGLLDSALNSILYDPPTSVLTLTVAVPTEPFSFLCAFLFEENRPRIFISARCKLIRFQNQ